MKLFSSVAASRPVRNITNEEFIHLSHFIYEQFGIFVPEHRKYLIENRLAGRLRELDLKSYGDYYYFLRYDPRRFTEISKLADVMTTNETCFYRNPQQLLVFERVVLPHLIERAESLDQKQLYFWSAGCSTGEEPYTLSIILHEVLRDALRDWDIRIFANDLSEGVLHAARTGMYSDYSLRMTPPDIMERYFSHENGVYAVDEKVKQLVSFSHLNLKDQIGMKALDASHIIFCRNVIIYFDDEMKKKVISSFYDNLLPGGYLFIGHSESLHSISRSFKPEHHPGTIVYKKQD